MPMLERSREMLHPEPLGGPLTVRALKHNHFASALILFWPYTHLRAFFFINVCALITNAALLHLIDPLAPPSSCQRAR